jgi:ferredoxin-like protein FixX
MPVADKEASFDREGKSRLVRPPPKVNRVVDRCPVTRYTRTGREDDGAAAVEPRPCIICVNTRLLSRASRNHDLLR